MASVADVAIVLSAKDNASSVIGGVERKLGGLPGIAGVATTALAGLGLAAGATLVGGLGAAVAAASGFEASLSGIKAVSGATAGEMDQLSNLALQLGKDTSFSASEAAKGIEELAKGGLTIADIMGGGAKASLDLAAAGAVSVAEAAEIAANAVGMFGKSGDQLAGVADRIAGVANASNASVSDFKFSMAAAGSTAKMMGMSFEDLSVQIAAMARQGILGSDAGTSLKAMLNQMIPTTKTATNTMRELGIITKDGTNRFFDASGKMKSWAEVSGILKDALAQLNPAMRTSALEAMFTTDGMRAAGIAADFGAEGMAKLEAEMLKVTAASVGAERLNNLKGSFEQLKGSAETAAITVGMALTPAIKGVVDAATGLLNAAMPAIEEFSKNLSQTIANIPENIQRGGVSWAAGGLATDLAKMLGVDQTGADDFGQRVMDFTKGINAALANIKIGFDAGGLSAAVGTASGIIAKALGFTPEEASGISNAADGVVKAIQKAGKDIDAAIINAQIGKASAEEAGQSGGGAAAGTLAGTIAKKLGFTPEASAEIAKGANSFVAQVEGALKSVDAIFKNRAGTGAQDAGELQLATIIKNAFGPEAVDPAITGIQNLDHAIENLDPTVRGLKSAFEEGGIREVVATTFGENTTQAMERFGDAVTNHVVPGLGLLIAKLGELTGQAVSSRGGVDGVKDSGDKLTQTLDFLTAAITNTGTAFEILGGLRDLSEIMKSQVTAHFDEVGKAAGNLGRDIANLAEGKATFDEVVAAAGLLKDAVVGHFVDTGKAGISLFNQLAGQAFPGIVSAGAGLQENLRADFTNIINKAGEMVGAISKAVTDIQNTITNAQAGLYNAAFNLGYNAVKGFIGGIDSLLGAAKTKAGELASEVAKVVGIKLESDSPSKVMYRYGQWFVDGLATGITDSKDKAMLAAQELAQDTAAALRTEMEGRLATHKFAIDEIKYSYEDLIEPLQRQLALLQNANDLTNERLSLEGQIAAAQLDAEIRAAKGDPRIRAELQGQLENIRTRQQDINLLQEEERIRKRIAEGKADAGDLAELELKKQQIAIQRQLGALVDKDKVAQLTVQKEILKATQDEVKFAEAIEKLEKQRLILPLKQQILDLNNAREDELDPLQRVVRELERQVKIHDLQQKGWDGIARSVEGVATAIRVDVGGALMDVAVDALGAGTSAAEAFQNGWEESMRQFNPQSSFDFLDQRDFDYWQGQKPSLPILNPIPSSGTATTPADLETALRGRAGQGLGAQSTTIIVNGPVLGDENVRHVMQGEVRAGISQRTDSARISYRAAGLV